MGWSFACEKGKLKDTLAELTTSQSNARTDANGKQTGIHIRKCLAHKYWFDNPGAGRLWTVWEYWDENIFGRVITPKVRYIGYDLIRCHRGCWGYKNMTAQCGVGDVSCPLKYLEMVPLELCKKLKQCSKKDYGDNACSCGGCHGCGACWETSWRNEIMAKSGELEKTRQLISTLSNGDVAWLKDGYHRNGQKWVALEGNVLPKGVQFKVIDYEKTFAAKMGLELED